MFFIKFAGSKKAETTVKFISADTAFSKLDSINNRRLFVADMSADESLLKNRIKVIRRIFKRCIRVSA